MQELLKSEEFLEFLSKRQEVKSDPRDLFNLVVRPYICFSPFSFPKTLRFSIVAPGDQGYR